MPSDLEHIEYNCRLAFMHYSSQTYMIYFKTTICSICIQYNCFRKNKGENHIRIMKILIVKEGSHMNMQTHAWTFIQTNTHTHWISLTPLHTYTLGSWCDKYTHMYIYIYMYSTHFCILYIIHVYICMYQAIWICSSLTWVKMNVKQNKSSNFDKALFP